MSPAEREREMRNHQHGNQLGKKQDENGEFMSEDDSLTDNSGIERPFEEADGMC